MRVFVLSPGRSGTLSFARACSHITNYTSGHEINASTPHARLAYPDKHIEVDHRLTFFLGTLDRLYPSSLYVWLYRDPEQVIESWAARTSPRSLAQAWPRAAFYQGHDWPASPPRLDLIRLMVESTNDNIRAFIRHRNSMTIRVDALHFGFSRLWSKIEAEGDLQSAHRELDVRHNARR